MYLRIRGQLFTQNDVDFQLGIFISMCVLDPLILNSLVEVAKIFLPSFFPIIMFAHMLSRLVLSNIAFIPQILILGQLRDNITRSYLSWSIRSRLDCPECPGYGVVSFRHYLQHLVVLTVARKCQV